MKKKSIFKHFPPLWRKEILLRMKITTILCLVFTMHLSASVFSQNEKISLTMKNATIESILAKASKITDLDFFYSTDKINVKEKVNIRIKDKSVEEFLKLVFKSQNVCFEFNKNFVIISRNESNDLDLKFNDLEKITIKGNVKDKEGNTLPGVTVMIKGSMMGVVTNNEGDFNISFNKSDNIVLVFSFVGMKTQELEYNGQKEVNIILLEDTKELEDVVVIGYMPRKIANTSASVIKVDAATIANKPVANPLDAIQGKVAGLQIFSSSGEPSAQLSIALHGQGSLGAGTAPLIIMDGIPVGMATIQAMNPNDIENIQFLKDAAATSIYGARAANGVMYIITKRGKISEKANIKVRAQYGVSKLANTDYFDELMTGPELLKYYVETGLYTQEEVNLLNDKTFKGTDFCWYKYIYNPAPLYSADFSISGGTGKTSYYLSAGSVKQDGLRLASSYKKAFTRINLNTEFNKYVRASLNTSLSWDETKRSPFGNNNASGGGLAAMNAPFVSPFDPDSGKELDYIPLLSMTTPKHVIATNPSSTNSYFLSASGNLRINPTKDLTIRSQVGVEACYSKSKSRVLPSYRNAYGIGSSSRSFADVVNISTNNTISYFKNFGYNNLTALIGHEYINYKDDGFSAGGSGILDDRLVLLNNVTKDKYMNETGLSYAFLSFFSQLSYDYNEKYFVDLVFRNDASSRFGKNKRNGLFWSVGLLWKVKKEGFLANKTWINSLDFKTSYGTQGNSAIPPYAIKSYTGKVGQKQGNISLGFVSYGNPNLGWERQRKFTIGAKTRIFNSINIDLEYYYRLTSNMLFELPLSMSTGLSEGSLGFVTRFDNVGKYLNQGIDIQLNFDIFKRKNYGISAYVNFNYNKGEVKELFEGRQKWFEPGSQLAYIVGKPITFVCPLYKGVNSQTGKPEWYVPGNDISKTTRDDSHVVSEYSNSLEQNTGTAVYTPTTGGWGLSAYWRGFYMSLDFAFALGKHILSMDMQRYENDYYVRNKDANFNGSRRLLNYWKKEGDVVDFPSLEYVRSYNHQSTYLDSKILENASFMRLKNLTIGYNVPQSALKNQKFLNSAKIYFAGRNLLTFTNFRGIDPEVNQSVSFGVNPNTKQFSLGLELGF